MEQRLQEVLSGKIPNYIYPFLWLHGEAHKTLLQEIHKIHESGIGGLCVESRTHEGFCEQSWWEDVKLLLEECKKLGMQVWILDDKHFPSGYANGIIERKYPELKKWEITERHMDVSGPVWDGAVDVEGFKTSCEDEILAVLACEKIPNSTELSGKTLDLTKDIQDGMVYFDLPEGCYRIVVLLKTRTGMSKKEQIFCDKLNPLATDAYIEAVYEPHYEHLKAYFGTTLQGFFSDEPQFGNNIVNKWWTSMGDPKAHYPWQERVADRLRERYGEDLYRKLAGIWFDFAGGKSAEIRIAYMDVITDAYRKYFCNKLADWCHSHGVLYAGHVLEDNQIHYKTGWGAGHYFRSTQGQDLSGIDVVIQQIIPGMTEYPTAAEVVYDEVDPEFHHYILGKLGASSAHIQPDKQGRALCEIFGAYGWPEGLKMMKWLTDHALVRGMNRFIPHAFSQKIDDPDGPPHFYARGRNPQYRAFRILMGYMNRMCHLLSSGTHVASALILYGAQADWAGQECMSMEKVAKTLYDHQIDYDIVPEDELKNIQNHEGKLKLNQECYHCLIVPYSKCLPVSILRDIKRIQEEGMLVIFAGKFVETSAEGTDGLEWLRESETLREVPLEDLVSCMKDRGMADVEMETPNMFLRVYHYRRGNSHLYMLNNEDAHHTLESKIRVPVFQGGTYAVYDGMKNHAELRTSQDSGIGIKLAPYQSMLLLFGETEGILPGKVCHIIERKELEQSYRISLAKEQEQLSFELYREKSRLFNITGRQGIPDFSGHIRYQTQFWLDQKGLYLLDLGYAGETAEVWVNGKHVGIQIAPPYRFEIGEAVKEGTNSLEVIVTNHYGYHMRDSLGKYLLYEASGLLGPVMLEKYEER